MLGQMSERDLQKSEQQINCFDPLPNNANHQKTVA
jgi:hypothetical protein